MKLNILCDADWRAGIDRVLNDLSGLEYWRPFEEKNYGSGLSKLVVVLICHDQSLGLSKRVRYSRKERVMYLDIMLDLEKMTSISHAERRREIGRRLLEEVPAVLAAKRIADFDLVGFLADLRARVASFGWM